MIEPACHKCLKELEDYGAIVLSPPERDGRCDKYHICKKCWEKLLDFMGEMEALTGKEQKEGD